MNFLNTIPLPFWLLTLVPLAIFLLNRRQKQLVRFSSIKFLLKLKTDEINRIKLLNIILLIIRTLIILIILLIIMRPYYNNMALPADFSDQKIHNFILIDDSFYNKYGFYDDDLRFGYIDKTVSKIAAQYKDNTKLTISSINKGLIFDGFNKDEVIYADLDKQIFNYNNNNVFYKQELNNINNLHLISNLNKNFINHINDSVSSKFDNFYNIYYYNLPSIDSNIYISNVKLIDKDYNNYKFSYEVGSLGFPDKDLNLSVYKNDYSYDNQLQISQRIPIFSEKITIGQNTILSDTLELNYQPNYLSEIVFKLENIDKSDFDDNLYEDNQFSFINNRLKNVSTTVFFNDENEKKYISNILNSFKILTENIDSSFFKVNFINESEFNKFSKEVIESDVFIFLGYNLFSNISIDIFDSFEDRNVHLLVFPSNRDLEKDKFNLVINDSLNVNLNRVKNLEGNFDTLYFNKEAFNYLKDVNKDKLKLNSYFTHDYNENSNFSTRIDNSIWSTYSDKFIKIDLFGFMVDKGNSFFSDKSLLAVPLIYDVIMNQKLNFNKNNLVLNKQNTISNHIKRYQLKDIFNDSITFVDNKMPIFKKNNTKLLFEENIIIDLYSFNPPYLSNDSFYEKTILEEQITDNIINIPEFLNNSNNTLSTLSINELTKYLIFLLFILLFIEMALSNVKTSSRND